jgi:hypothetical protein
MAETTLGRCRHSAARKVPSARRTRAPGTSIAAEVLAHGINAYLVTSVRHKGRYQRIGAVAVTGNRVIGKLLA